MKKNFSVAFEISPLLTASGTFGDKSGVYRYMTGLIGTFSSLNNFNKEKNKIILFTFYRNLLTNFNNFDASFLLNQKNCIFLNKYYEFKGEPKIGTSVKQLFFNLPPFKYLFKLINKFLGVKKIYDSLREYVHNTQYLKYIDDEFKKNNIKIIFHSQTCFHPLKGYKHIATIYDLTPRLYPYYHRPETIDLHQRKIDFVRNYCQGIVCISKSTKNDLLKYYPSLRNKKIIVAYPGANSLINRESPKEKESFNDITLLIKKNKQSLSPKKYLLYFGTFEPRKNVIGLVKAFTDLQEKKEIPPEFKLILIGGEGWGNIKKMITDHINENFPNKSKNNIILLNYLSDKYLGSLIQNAYASVYPSIYEGFGLPVLESMVLGTPVICANNSSLPEVGGRAVLYFDTNNYQDIREKIKLLIDNSSLAKTLSKKGVEQSKKFSWKKTARQLYNFLQDL